MNRLKLQKTWYDPVFAVRAKQGAITIYEKSNFDSVPCSLVADQLSVGAVGSGQ
jgi:hypothetical protein